MRVRMSQCLAKRQGCPLAIPGHLCLNPGLRAKFSGDGACTDMEKHCTLALLHTVSIDWPIAHKQEYSRHMMQTFVNTGIYTRRSHQSQTGYPACKRSAVAEIDLLLEVMGTTTVRREERGSPSCAMASLAAPAPRSNPPLIGLAHKRYGNGFAMRMDDTRPNQRQLQQTKTRLWRKGGGMGRQAIQGLKLPTSSPFLNPPPKSLPPADPSGPARHS